MLDIFTQALKEEEYLNTYKLGRKSRRKKYLSVSVFELFGRASRSPSAFGGLSAGWFVQ